MRVRDVRDVDEIEGEVIHLEKVVRMLEELVGLMPDSLGLNDARGLVLSAKDEAVERLEYRYVELTYATRGKIKP